MWNVVTYSISYSLNGGTLSENPSSYTVETTTFTLNNPTKTGYTFTGWTGSNGATAQTTVTISKGSTGNKEYTANWTANEYTITYDKNYYDSNLIADTTNETTYNTWRTTVTKSTVSDFSTQNGNFIKFVFGPVTDTKNGISKGNFDALTIGETYTFSVYLKSNKNRVMRIGPQQGGQINVNVTTEWQKFTKTFVARENQYTTFVFYGFETDNLFNEGDELYIHSLELTKGSPTHTTENKTYGTTLGTLTTLSRTNYIFKGWYTEPTGGKRISDTTPVPAQNTTYYAQWEYVNMDSISATRTYIGVNGSTTTSTVSVTGTNLGTVTYKSSNTNIATVNSSGVVTAKTAGEVTITARASTDTSVYKQIKIYVTSLTATNSAQTVLEDATITLSPTKSTYAGTVSYTTSNNAYATVSNAGVVKGIDIGTSVSQVVTITAKEANGGATCTYTITVRVWATGNGTSSSPYLITNTRDITKLASKVNSSTASNYRYSNTYFKQTADITLGNWTPIASSDSLYFSGIYNGNGRYITGINISNKNENIGLFGANSGTIKNLILAGNITGGYAVGGIAGVNSGLIQNCINKASVTGQMYIGGIAGSNYGTVTKCSNTGTILLKDMYVSSDKWYYNYVNSGGGITGVNASTLTLSFNKGKVSIQKNNTAHDEYSIIGGLTGYNGDTLGNAGTLQYCYNRGTVSGYGSLFGGIAGDHFDGYISACYNTGSVTSTKSGASIGAILGALNDNINYCYALSGTASSTYGEIWNTSATNGTSFQTSNWLKTTLVDSNNFKLDSSNINDGYQILSWQ